MKASMVAALTSWILLALPAVAQTPPHPLAGKIFDTRTGALTDLTDPALIPALFPCGAITLLGEVHDNGAHHRMRGDLLRAMKLNAHGGYLNDIVQIRCLADGAFVMEQIEPKQVQAAFGLLSCAKNHPECRSADELLERLNWDKSGWPSAKIYQPLFQSIMEAEWWLYAGSPGNDLIRKISKEGLGAVEQEVVRRFHLAQPLPPDLQDDLLGELEASHCGLMPKTAFGNMAMAQRYRDANMADVALKAAEAKGNIVIFAGNGHVRTDRGIPWYIRLRAPDRKVISVAFVETEDGKTDPTAYRPQDSAGKPAADYIAFALPATREDPCEQMRNHMKK